MQHCVIFIDQKKTSKIIKSTLILTTVQTLAMLVFAYFT